MGVEGEKKRTLNTDGRAAAVSKVPRIAMRSLVLELRVICAQFHLQLFLVFISHFIEIHFFFLLSCWRLSQGSVPPFPHGLSSELVKVFTLCKKKKKATEKSLMHHEAFVPACLSRQ